MEKLLVAEFRIANEEKQWLCKLIYFLGDTWGVVLLKAEMPISGF